MKFRSSLSVVVPGVALAVASAALADQAPDPAAAHATATVKAMTPAEKTVLTNGIMAISFGPFTTRLPADAVPGAGYVAGIERLNIPALKETDASLGVAWVGGLRHDGATPLPSGLAQAASWNPALLREGGAMIGAEARAKGFNVLLAGGTNLMRDPRNGRTFEYLSEDPLLSGTLVGNAIAGIQSNNIISTIKHFALNGQETGRHTVDTLISEPAARESDLLAFQIGIEIGHPGSVMCSYNKINGAFGCNNDWLLNTVLKHDWKYPGFVMSDWGAVPGLEAAWHGLDQQSGDQLDGAVYFGAPLAAAAAADKARAARLDDMNHRVLWAIYSTGLDQHPVAPGGAIDFEAHAKVAEAVARQGIVLLRNAHDALPLPASAKRIAVIGGYANSGVLSGGGSSQVDAPGGPAINVPLGGELSFVGGQHYHPSSPLAAIRAHAPQAVVTYRNGDYVTDAVDQARKADVAIVFATKWSTEGMDQADLTLPNGQDALIAAVAAANPNTIVVLETGNPVQMPWLDKTAAVLEAWYPGARGGEAIASVLFGETNPSGRLPITFPASESQLPRPRVDGYFDFEPNMMGVIRAAQGLSANYDVEGSNLGYRWNAQKGQKALFPFGFGLSYTRFADSDLAIKGLNATVTVANTGARAGDDVVQLYLVSRAGKPIERLAAFQRVALAAGARQTVSLTIDPRLLADWRKDGWALPAGDYGFAVGRNAEELGPVTTVHLLAKNWKD